MPYKEKRFGGLGEEGMGGICMDYRFEPAVPVSDLGDRQSLLVTVNLN